MKRTVWFFITLLLCWVFISNRLTDHVHAEEKASFVTKREFRAAWVATVHNIDMDQQYGKTESAINNWKQEYIKILNTLEEYNMNAVIFQIRPANDAFYVSKLNPWSQYLCGFQGCDPGWDPLPWMIEETHKRGMEFHAWLNPYRVSTGFVGKNGYDSKELLLKSLAEDNFARQHPEYVILAKPDSNGRRYPILNPGEPAVKEFILETIEEIITKYDVDAIHFDDYFYPYAGIEDADDKELYHQHCLPNESLADWRRRNVDEIIYRISELIRHYNEENQKTVQFGISPFGIWANKSASIPEGSDTRGNQSYVTQYADTRKWVLEEWIDYIAPQLYWNIGHSAADYEVLAHWWADVVRGTKVNLYIGHGFYRYGEGGAWNLPQEIPNQLQLNAEIPEIKGSIFYSYRHFHRTDHHSIVSARNTIKQEYWNTKVLLPELPRMAHIPNEPVEDIVLTKAGEGFVTLRWDHKTTNKFYIVYRFESGESEELNDDNIIAFVEPEKDGETVLFNDADVEVGKTYVYHVVAVNKANVESESVSFEYTHTGEEYQDPDYEEPEPNPDPEPDPDPDPDPDPEPGPDPDSNPDAEDGTLWIKILAIAGGMFFILLIGVLVHRRNMIKER